MRLQLGAFVTTVSRLRKCAGSGAAMYKRRFSSRCTKQIARPSQAVLYTAPNGRESAHCLPCAWEFLTLPRHDPESFTEDDGAHAQHPWPTPRPLHTDEHHQAMRTDTVRWHALPLHSVRVGTRRYEVSRQCACGVVLSRWSRGALLAESEELVRPGAIVAPLGLSLHQVMSVYARLVLRSVGGRLSDAAELLDCSTALVRRLTTSLR